MSQFRFLNFAGKPDLWIIDASLEKFEVFELDRLSGGGTV
jgi:hypothetical protein